MTFHEFYVQVVLRLKKMKSLQYLSLVNNPIGDKIEEFKLFLIFELPQLVYLDWELITKRDRVRAKKCQRRGLWVSKFDPYAETNHSGENNNNTTKSSESQDEVLFKLSSFNPVCNEENKADSCDKGLFSRYFLY